MTAKIAVTVAVDMDVRHVTLKPAGSLTDHNVRALVAVARRAERVLPGFTVCLDVGMLHGVSSGALRVLADAGIEALPAPPRLDHHEPRRRTTGPMLVA